MHRVIDERPLYEPWHTIYVLTKEGEKVKVNLDPRSLGLEHRLLEYERESQTDVIEAKNDKFKDFITMLKRELDETKTLELQERYKKQLELLERVSGIIVITRYFKMGIKTYKD